MFASWYVRTSRVPGPSGVSNEATSLAISSILPLGASTTTALSPGAAVTITRSSVSSPVARPP